MNHTNIMEDVILIVDDNLKNIQVLGNILREEGYKISIAQNGYKAIEIAEQIRPTLILLDIMMPEIDGFQVCENLKSKPATKSIPIIFLTAKVETSDIVYGFKIGGVDYITKPYKKEELLSRVNTHIELENARKSLFNLNAQKDRMFSIVSHDLRSPLSSYKTLLGLILESPKAFPQDKIMSCLADFKEDIDSIYFMLENLLVWAKSEMQGGSMSNKEFLVNPLLDSIIRFLSVSAKKKDIKITNQIDKPIHVFADQDMVSTIFRNLVNNAIKFSPKEGDVFITAIEKQSEHIFIVEDNGIGIPQDKQQKLLDETRYYTSKGTDKEKGSGLGLNLCKSLVERNNGELWFESNEGKGSKFYFSLPKT